MCAFKVFKYAAFLNEHHTVLAMVHYKLYYFNVRNIGEPIRLILHYANQPFEDYRCHSMEEWAKLKPSEYFLISIQFRHFECNTSAHAIASL